MCNRGRLLLLIKICHEILNIRSTLADDAGTPKKRFAKGANNGKEYSLFFQNNKGSSLLELAIKDAYSSIIIISCTIVHAAL